MTHATCADWIYGGQPDGTRWCSTLVDSQGEHVNGEYNMYYVVTVFIF